MKQDWFGTYHGFAEGSCNWNKINSTFIFIGHLLIWMKVQQGQLVLPNQGLGTLLKSDEYLQENVEYYICRRQFYSLKAKK